MRFFLRALILVFCLPSGLARSDELVVAAAISLQPALEELDRLYTQEKPKTPKVRYHFASSGALKSQVIQGAPIDLFIAAADEVMDELEQRKLIQADSRVNWLSNRLVLVTPTGKRAPQKLEDLQHSDFKKIAIGDVKTVPAGSYAWEVLERKGLTEVLKSQLVYASNVRQVLTYIEQGAAQAGFVYASDLASSRAVQVAIEVPSELHRPIHYPAAVLQRTKKAAAAKALLQFWQSAQALKVFERHGLIVARKAS
ncbi:MAG: molybdate ABC transporter substrate-binding protein [Oligoflexus sp.]|jgi:molybdate transport system substrate-binding protein